VGAVEARAVRAEAQGFNLSGAADALGEQVVF
jgi:hypothetical protein